jgi:hypothetical protein
VGTRGAREVIPLSSKFLLLTRVLTISCFSTRMMWRKDGEGELYLVSPQVMSGD